MSSVEKGSSGCNAASRVAVDDINAVVARLLARHGELVGEGENYEETYLLCHIVARTGSSSSYAERIG